MVKIGGDLFEQPNGLSRSFPSRIKGCHHKMGKQHKTYMIVFFNKMHLDNKHANNLHIFL